MSKIMKFMRSCDACEGKKTIKWDRSKPGFDGKSIICIRCEGCGAEIQMEVTE